MPYTIHDIVFYRDLTPEQAEELRRVLDGDPSAASLFRRWRALRESLSAEIDSALEDRDLFALYVLRENGRGDLLSPAERERVEKAAPALRGALQRYPGLSAVSGDLTSDANAFEQAWNEWFGREAGGDREPIREDLQRSVRRRGRSGRGAGPAARRWLVRAGMGAAVVVFVALLLLIVRRDFAGVTVATASGEVRVVELGDGSSVRMLGNSRLTYVPLQRAMAIDRQADFEGRGFFEVASDQRGFVLKTPNAQAVVIGTSFGIEADREQTEVVLAAGRLTLSTRRAPEQVVVLSAGQMSRVVGSAGPSAPVDVRVHERLSWTGLFVFHAAPVGEILADLSRAYEVDLEADETLLAEQVTGRFERDQGLIDILEVVAAAVDARVDQRGTGYRLLAR